MGQLIACLNASKTIHISAPIRIRTTSPSLSNLYPRHCTNYEIRSAVLNYKRRDALIAYRKSCGQPSFIIQMERKNFLSSWNP